MEISGRFLQSVVFRRQRRMKVNSPWKYFSFSANTKLPNILLALMVHQSFCQLQERLDLVHAQMHDLSNFIKRNNGLKSWVPRSNLIFRCLREDWGIYNGVFWCFRFCFLGVFLVSFTYLLRRVAWTSENI